MEVNIDPTPRCLICVAPHTSNWDFIVGELAIRSVGMTAGFLMKSVWFFFPVGILLRAIGGIPVHQNKKQPSGTENTIHETDANLHGHEPVTQVVTRAFAQKERLAIAITPEGTRSRNPHWHHGILTIASNAHVPIVLACIDYSRRVACLDRVMQPTDNPDADMRAIKSYYADKAKAAKYPDKFAL